MKLESLQDRFGDRGPLVAKLAERSRLVLLVCILILGGLPLVFVESILLTVTTMLIWGLFAAGFDFMFGYTGEVSFGHSAFFGTGAYVLAITLDNTGISSIVLLLGLAFVASFLLAVILGTISFRASGVYFAILTLAWAELVYLTIRNGGEFTGASDGLSVVLPELGFSGSIGFSLYSITVQYYLAATATVVLVTALYVLTKSQFGLVMKAIKESDDRLEYLGYDVKWYKVLVFGISGGVSGIAGCLLGITTSYVAPSFARILISGEVILYTIIGGAGTLVGPLLGAGIIKYLEGVFSVAFDWWLIPLNLMIILAVLFLPEGIGGKLRGE